MDQKAYCMLNPEALESKAKELPDSDAAVSLFREAVLKAAEQDPRFSTDNWPAACRVITALAAHNLQASRMLLQELHEKAEECHELEAPEHLKEFASAYQRRIRELRREIKSQIICERIQSSSAEEIKARITLLALNNEKPDGVERDELVLAVLKYDPERACVLAREWRANGKVIDSLFPSCKDACPERLLQLILHSYSRDKWLEIWVGSLVASLNADTLPQLLQLLRLLKENVRTSLVYQGTDLLLLDAVRNLPEALRKDCLNALADILVLALPMVPLIVAQGLRTTDTVQTLIRLWEADPTEIWAKRVLQILEGFPIQQRKELVLELQDVLPGNTTNSKALIIGLKKVCQA